MKQKKTLLLILGVLLAAAVVVGLFFGVKALIKAGQTPEATGDQPVQTDAPSTEGSADPTAETPTEDPSLEAIKARDFYTEDEVSPDDPRFDEVIAVCGDYTLTNRQAAVFYGMQYVGLVSQVSQYGMSPADIGLDMSKPLKDQESMSIGLTWEQSFLSAALDEFEQYAAAATASIKAGYVLPEAEKQDLESFLAEQEVYAAEEGFESVDAYFQDSFGPAVHFEDYENYLRLYFQAMSYENSIYMSYEPSDEELEAYREAHLDDFANTDLEAKSVNVRHILFLSGSGDGSATEEQKAEAKAKAEAILAEYLTDPTEDHFADLAMENSEDPGSASYGGLYEGVYEGQMVQTFNDWCFDEARQPGDTDIVETEYGFHVMYFVSSDLQWKSTARHQLRMEYTDPIVNEIHETYTSEVAYDKILLAPLPLSEAAE